MQYTADDHAKYRRRQDEKAAKEAEEQRERMEKQSAWSPLLFVKLFVDGPLGTPAPRLEEGRPPGVPGPILSGGARPPAPR
jgi:hypothetical protein